MTAPMLFENEYLELLWQWLVIYFLTVPIYAEYLASVWSMLTTLMECQLCMTGLL